MTDNNTAKPSTKRASKMAREPKLNGAGRALPKCKTKTSAVLAMLERHEGSTLEQFATATGWLPHTARAAMTGLKRKGHVITSDKPADGVRTYRIAQVAEPSR